MKKIKLSKTYTVGEVANILDTSAINVLDMLNGEQIYGNYDGDSWSIPGEYLQEYLARAKREVVSPDSATASFDELPEKCEMDINIMLDGLTKESIPEDRDKICATIDTIIRLSARCVHMLNQTSYGEPLEVRYGELLYSYVDMVHNQQPCLPLTQSVISNEEKNEQKN